MAIETRWVPYGEAAVDALAAVVRAAKTDDPMAPVTVVTPSAGVAVATRRALARRLGGMAGVEFLHLGALAEALAAAHVTEAGIEVGVDRELVTAAVRVVLAERPGGFGGIDHHRSTWEALAASVGEIADLGPERRHQIAAAGGISADLVAVHDAVAERIAIGGEAGMLRLATTLVDDGRVDAGGRAPFVVHLPDRIDEAGVGLLAALGRRSSMTLLLGTGGRPDDDADLVESLAGLGVTPPRIEVPERRATAVISANDVDDEVQAVVRRLLAIAEGGVPLQDLALVHPAGSPYARIVHDVLTATGVPFSGPSIRTLGQTAPGRVLLGLLDVIGGGFARQDVVDLWSAGIVVDGDAHPLPFSRFDEQSRWLGIVAGRDRWEQALPAEAVRLRARDQDANTANRLETIVGMEAAVAVLADLADRMPERWGDVAAWAAEGLDVLCGPRTRRTWPEAELDADEAIRSALGRLAALEEVEPAPAARLVHSTIRTLLDAPAPRATRSGTGIAVTTLEQPPVVPLHTVAVVGLVEGQAPRSVRDDVLVGEATRAATGLVTARSRQRRQRRAFDATLASASVGRILGFARNDQRSGRTLVPSRWLVDEIERLSGVRPDIEALREGRPAAGVEVVASFDAGIRQIGDDSAPAVALHAAERDLAAIASHLGADPHPAVAAAPLREGRALVAARRSSSFTRFDGNLDGDGVDTSGLGVLSPTSLETYAACPRRWFFRHVLKIGRPDRPEEIDRLDPREQGTLVHRVLERFFGAAIEAGTVPEPGIGWTSAALVDLEAIFAEECELLEGRGITGHRRWWEHDRANMWGLLVRTLDRDVTLRAERGAMPVAVEFTFGRHGQPPLEIDLGDGRRLLLSGQADRVDVADGVAHVWDYKHASSSSYEVIRRDEAKNGDRLDQGRKIQLVAYAWAAAEHLGIDEVHANYWFLKPGHEGKLAGYPVDADLRERLRRVLRILVDGIEGGRFPARPGPFEYFLGGHANCGWCDYNTICPADREEEWQRVRFDPSLRRLASLSDEGTASVMADGGDR